MLKINRRHLIPLWGTPFLVLPGCGSSIAPKYNPVAITELVGVSTTRLTDLGKGTPLLLLSVSTEAIGADLTNEEIFALPVNGVTPFRLTRFTSAERWPDLGIVNKQVRLVCARTRDAGTNVNRLGLKGAQASDLWLLNDDGQPDASTSFIPPSFGLDRSLPNPALKTGSEGDGLNPDLTSEEKTFLKSGRQVAFSRVHPGGRYCAISVYKEDGAGALFLVDLAKSGRQRPRKLADVAGPCTWTPDGKKLLVSGRAKDDTGDRIYLVDGITGETKALTKPRDLMVAGSGQAEDDFPTLVVNDGNTWVVFNRLAQGQGSVPAQINSAPGTFRNGLYALRLKSDTFEIFTQKGANDKDVEDKPYLLKDGIFRAASANGMSVATLTTPLLPGGGAILVVALNVYKIDLTINSSTGAPVLNASNMTEWPGLSGLNVTSLNWATIPTETMD